MRSAEVSCVNLDVLYAIGFAALCWIFRALTWDGALAAAAVGAAVWYAGEWQAAAPLLAFFLTASALSLIRKTKRGDLDLDSRPRNAIQVLANGGPAAVCAAIYIYFPEAALLVAMIASLAAANADTWATEVGSLIGRKPFRILSLSPAPPGESGVITIAGLVAAFLGAATVAATAPLLSLTKYIGVLSVVGFFSCILDSLLGDGVQARYRREDGHIYESKPGQLISGWRWMTNDTVNFISTALAATAGYWIARFS
jgi:uncharacterized protein (TIGR00297 family)